MLRRTLLAVVLLLLASSGNLFATTFPLEIIDHLDETKIVIYVNESDIEASPPWSPSTGAPAFGLADLLKTVAAWKKKNKCSDGDSVEKIELKPIVHHKKQGRWYYLVQLKDVVKGKLSHRYLAVLMNGKAVPAVMEPEAYK